MTRITELRIRGDWQFVRFAYLPALGVGLIPFQPCAICTFCYWWGHHFEEWVRRKSLFRITDTGLLYEDGSKPFEYSWPDIQGIVLERRNEIPCWRTNGSTQIGTPRSWLSITVRQRRINGRLSKFFRAPDQDEFRTICIWPRQVVGGLFALMRFAKELQRHLIHLADQGKIPLLLERRPQPPSEPGRSTSARIAISRE